MRVRARRPVSFALMLVVLCVSAVPGSAHSTDPTVQVDRTGTADGEKMLVTGAGWPKGASLIVELCGHGGLAGSVDCDVPHQKTAGVGSEGTFSVELTTGLPPKACPCVVKATDQSTHIAATAPIAVAGVYTLPITDAKEQVDRAVEVSSIEITGGGHLAELFGAGGRRTLEMTLVNTGEVPVQAPDVSIAWGKGAHPDGFVKPPETKALEPGETQTITVGLDRSALTIGEQTAVVEVDGFGEPIVAKTTTSGYPWGLIAIALVLLQLLLLKIRNWYRRRHQGGDPDDVDGPDEMASLPPGAIAALPPAPDDVIDVRDLDEEADREIVLDGDVPEPEPVDADLDLVPSSATLLAGTLLMGAAANGHDRNGNGNGHKPEVDGVVVGDVDAHAAATAALSAGLIAEFVERTGALRDQVEVERQRASSSLNQAVMLSEALVAAAEVRAAEVRAASERREARANDALQEAIDTLDEARAHAGELIDMAQRAAGQILAEADLERDAARRALSGLESERDELVAAARESMRVVTEQLRDRFEGLDEDLQGQVSALLLAASAERRAPEPVDELDRRLARAVERALSEV